MLSTLDGLSTGSVCQLLTSARGAARDVPSTSHGASDGFRRGAGRSVLSARPQLSCLLPGPLPVVCGGLSVVGSRHRYYLFIAVVPILACRPFGHVSRYPAWAASLVLSSAACRVVVVAAGVVPATPPPPDDVFCLRHAQSDGVGPSFAGHVADTRV